jgi:ATP-dependent Zn protease
MWGMDAEARRLLDEAEQQARDLFGESAARLAALAAAPREHEVLEDEPLQVLALPARRTKAACRPLTD